MDSTGPIGQVFQNLFDTMLFLIGNFLQQAVAILLAGFNSLLP